MNKFIQMLLLAAIISLSGCSVYRETMRGLFRNMGLIQTRDIDQARYIREKLPAHLGIDTKTVHVSPGSNDSKLYIQGIAQKDQAAVLAKIEEFRCNAYLTYESEPNRKFPLKPITVEFRD